MKKRITLNTIKEIDGYMDDLRTSAEEVELKLAQVLEHADPLDLLYRIKFEGIGCDPFDSRRSLNLVEQINQTFTYLASFKAAKMLFLWHQGLTSLRLNLGTQSGTDIESDCDGGISAEVFAAVAPSSNDKLRKDINKLWNFGNVVSYVA